MKLERIYKNLERYLKPNKILVIYGPRQVGKTTLLNDFLAKTRLKYKLDSGDNIRTREILASQDFDRIKEYVSDYELLAIDEAQKIPNIGQALKIIVDQVPGIFVVVTGSSSFELSGQIGEPLTGRKRTLNLYPLSQAELAKLHNLFELREKIPKWIIFGGYPEVITSKSKKDKIIVLEELVNSYLLKDILELEKIKSSKIILDLLRMLAFQIGNEVSFSELGKKLGLDRKTVARYIDLLEKSFVVFTLSGFSKNLRKEITKKNKYYFFDNGVRNAIISNYNDIALRDDVGKLWENFLAIERIKTQEYKNISANNYFWRTWNQQEIDWIEEREGKIFAYEFKLTKNKVKIPKDFSRTYPQAKFKTVTQENYTDFLELTS